MNITIQLEIAELLEAIGLGDLEYAEHDLRLVADKLVIELRNAGKLDRKSWHGCRMSIDGTLEDI